MSPKDNSSKRHVFFSARDTSAPVRVFLIEDHPVVREGTRRLLEFEEGATVVGEADSGENALVSPSLGLAEVVLCDVMLPGMDGIALAHAFTNWGGRLEREFIVPAGYGLYEQSSAGVGVLVDIAYEVL